MVTLPGLRGALDVLGEVPPGLPSPGLPALNWTDARALLPAAAAIALISYLESISTASARVGPVQRRQARAGQSGRHLTEDVESAAQTGKRGHDGRRGHDEQGSGQPRDEAAHQHQGDDHPHADRHRQQSGVAEAG